MDLADAHRLTAPFQLCLAHYCDLHGPTPMMVTEGLPVPCTTCFDHDPDPPSGPSPPATAAPSVAAITDALRSIDFTPHRTSSLPASQAPRPPAPVRSPTSPVESPANPDPLRRGADRRDGTFRKTYDEGVTKRAHPCANCAMTLPASDDNPSRERGPTLRTRAPYAWVFGGPGESPPASQASSGSDTSGDGEEPKLRGARTGTGTGTASASSRSSGSTPGSHTHFVEYISTKEPLLPSSFSIVRASCLRTLSFEMLPRAQTSPPPQTSLPSTGAPASSGGPIFFGDPGAGYTTAYIFRVPDPYARGHRRIYAFLALSTHGERTAMKTFNLASGAFRDLAGWITAMAEAEAESGAESPRGAVEGSFLTGGGSGGAFARRGPGMGGGLGKVRQRGLAEVVGCPDFFIQLHIRFVKILRELGVKMNG